MLQTNSIAPEKRDRAIEVIERNAVAQSQLVEDLLDMSRITTGRVRLDPEPVLVVTDPARGRRGHQTGGRREALALDVDFDSAAGTVRADANRLQQVFWNVLSNAVKFTATAARLRSHFGATSATFEIRIDRYRARGSLPSSSRSCSSRSGRRRADSTARTAAWGWASPSRSSWSSCTAARSTASSPGTGEGATFTIRLPCAFLRPTRKANEPACSNGESGQVRRTLNSRRP